MLRKILLSTLLAITAVTGVSFTAPVASAQPPQRRDDRNDRDRNDRDRNDRDRNDRDRNDRDRHDHRVRYQVLYRHRGHWDSFGTYRDRDDAERAAWRLRREGREVRIEREFVRW